MTDSFVLNRLKTEGIAVKARGLRDVHSRRAYLFQFSGRVLVKKPVRMHTDTVVKRGREYAERVNQGPVAGEIELPA